MKRAFRVTAIGLILVAVAMYAAPGAIERRYNHTLHAPPYKASSQAQKLHQTLMIADLHADSLLWNRNLLRRSQIGHVDVPRLRDGNVALQTFTVVTTSPKNLNINQNSSSSDLIRYVAIASGWPADTWNSPKQRALYQAQQLRRYAAKSNGELVLIRSQADLANFLTTRNENRRVAAFLGTEGAQPLEGDIKNLDVLYDAGFRMMSPAHFTDTEIGGSAAGVRKGGLTELGRKWVAAMEAKGMLIDLAHASTATLRDVAAIAKRPVIVSHTGVKGTCNNNRNLSDDELRAVAKTGGLIGIGYWDTAVCGSDADSIARAIHYATRVVGVDHVALGSDFDGTVTTPFDTSGLVLITDALLRQGFSEQDVRLIMGENVMHLLSRTLPEH